MPPTHFVPVPRRRTVRYGGRVGAVLTADPGTDRPLRGSEPLQEAGRAGQWRHGRGHSTKRGVTPGLPEAPPRSLPSGWPTTVGRASIGSHPGLPPSRGSPRCWRRPAPPPRPSWLPRRSPADLPLGPPDSFGGPWAEDMFGAGEAGLSGPAWDSPRAGVLAPPGQLAGCGSRLHVQVGSMTTPDSCTAYVHGLPPACPPGADGACPLGQKRRPLGPKTRPLGVRQGTLRVRKCTLPGCPGGRMSADLSALESQTASVTASRPCEGEVRFRRSWSASWPAA